MIRRWADVAASIALIAAVILLYRKVTRLWWTYDDAYLLHVAIVHPARDHFFGSSIWRAMPQRLFTPLLTATFDSELSLFGANAAAFYSVQLGLVALLAIALFFIARIRLSTAAAFTASLVCILGVPMCSLASELMLVHYIESLLLAAGAAGLFAIADRRGSRAAALAIGSAVLYLAAMLAKEIAVPLVAVLFLASRRRLRDRLALLAPHAAALVLYALWRRRELGEWLGGYGWTIRVEDLPALVAALPRTIAGELSGGTAAGVALLILIAAGVAWQMRTRTGAAIVVLVLLLAFGPLLPMAKKIEPRFLIVPWIAAVLFACAAFDRIERVPLRAAVFVVVIALAAAVNRVDWAREYRASQRMSDEARVFFDLDSGDVLRKPSIPPAAIGELDWLKQEYFHRGGGAGWFYDDLFLCDRPLPRRLFEYVPLRRQVVQVADAGRLRERYCAAIRLNAPLTASFHHDGESLFWSFGPYDRGKYAVVMADGVQAFDVPRKDGFRLPGVNGLTLRVRYESPDRWVTYSPDLSLDFARQRDYQWQR